MGFVILLTVAASFAIGYYTALAPTLSILTGVTIGLALTAMYAYWRERRG